MAIDEMSLPATKGDIIRLHEKVDSLKETLVREIPKQPCKILMKHVADHDTVKGDWRKALIRGVVSISQMALVALFTWYLVKGS